MTAGQLFGAAGIAYPPHIADISISRIVTDSREACRDCIFICLSGHNTDGHKYIQDAINKGAVVIVAEQVRDECVGGAAIIKVENTRRAAAKLYNIQCGINTLDLHIVGVTGTNGKTSVCAMLESIFLAAGVRCAVMGTTGCRVGGRQIEGGGGLTTPDVHELFPLLAKIAGEGVGYVFMEVSSHALAQHRVDGICFEWGVFTGLTRDHLDFHNDMEDYFLTKASLFSACGGGIINIDGAYGKRLADMYPHCVTCSVGGEGDFCATDVKYSPRGCEYKLKHRGGELPVSTSALGDFSAPNSLLAAVTALQMGIDQAAVIGGLSRFCGAEGRMERVVTDAPFEVIIDFAHTPDALERALKSASYLRGDGGRVIVVFGCGGDRDRGKRREMGGIASRLADEVVVTSDNPRSERREDIITDILRGVDKERPYKVIVSRRDAIEYALGVARQGDVVLLAGKGHERYEIDTEGKHFFDEREIVRTAIEKKNDVLRLYSDKQI